MRGALPLLLLLCACSLRAPRVKSTPCSATAQCDRPDVCFLGECRGHAAALTVVSAEIRPVNDSQLGVLQVADIDLRQSAVHDFLLVPPFVAKGTVTQEQNAGAAAVPVPNALVTFTGHAPAVPDRVQQVSARADNGGSYTARLPQGTWDVLVQPSAPLPPFRPAEPLVTGAPPPGFVLPRIGALGQFQAALTADGGVLAGAAVTAVDPAGNALSAPAQVQLDGGFSLYLPPGTGSYFLQVGPASDLDGGPAAASLDPLPSYDHLQPRTPAVDVPLPRVATLQGSVVDAAGAPVASALVYTRSDEPAWSLSRSTSTGADGSFSLQLREGNFVVEAAPAGTADAPGVSGEETVEVGPATPALRLVCPPKVRGFGLIVRPGGGAVSANYQITATRLADRLLTTRTAISTPTDSAGIWHITADPGRYRVEVVPSADSGLPRKIVQIELPAPTGNLEIQLPQINLSPPLVVGGAVCSGVPAGSPCISKGKPVANAQPVANATVSFYALDVNGHGILLGSAPTKADGSYTAVLPDVAQPGAAQHGY